MYDEPVQSIVERFDGAKKPYGTFGRRIRVISVMGWDFTAKKVVEVAKAAYESCEQRWYRVNDALC